ncbi:MAG: WXG100 family type VII secretion target [Candidatus Dormibacteraeota bacterium]|nr:WXG100 family type VII secretion target [Candidatus Dormibacteraeota bacterium]
MGQSWDWNPVHDGGNILSDIGGWFSGPPGDPGRIRAIASQIDSLNNEYTGHVGAINQAVTSLGETWGGDAGQAFIARWSACSTSGTSPADVMSHMSGSLQQFAAGLRNYADQLENAQHEHWMMLGVMAVLTIVNVAQLGLDPVTDAAEVGAGAVVDVAASMDVALPAAFVTGIEAAFSGAIIGFTSDVVAQLGADVWNRLDSQFDQTGNDGVPLFDPTQLALSTAGGALSFGLVGAGGSTFSGLLRNPLTRMFTVGASSAVTDAGGQLITTGHVDWSEVLMSSGVSGLAGASTLHTGDTSLVDPSVASLDAPSLRDVMGPARYDGFLDDVAQIKIDHPELTAIPDDDLVAIRGYTSNDTTPADYRIINDALRSADPVRIAPLSTYIDNIDSGLAQLPDHSGVVYRGTTLRDDVINAYRDAAADGTPVWERAFVSSSMDPSVTQQAPFDGNTRFVIESAHGKDITDISVYGTQEREVLFVHGTPFDVLSVTEFEPGRYEITMAELP